MYENRIVCFIDILGFKNIIADTVDIHGNFNTQGITNISHALQTMWDTLRPDEYEVEYRSVRFTHFSDSVIISFDYTENSQVFYTLIKILHAVVALTSHGLVCRGAVVVGPVHHTETQVFGPAVVKAYEMESKEAVYPRIIVDDIILHIAGKYRSEQHSYSEERAYVENLLRLDEDGRYYIDYFGAVSDEFDDYLYGFYAYLNGIRRIIILGLQASGPHVLNKYQWMQSKYNEVVSRIHINIDNNVFDDVDPEVLAAYRQLPLL